MGIVIKDASKIIDIVTRRGGIGKATILNMPSQNKLSSNRVIQNGKEILKIMNQK